MNIYEAIKNRHSVKKYTDKPVPNELVGGIIEAGTLAPNAGNKQNWKFIIVTNPKLKEAVASHSYEQYWMTSAPVYVVVCADEALNERFFPVVGKKYSIQNCSAAIENMLLTATAFGLGSCWVGGFDEKEVKLDLGIPGSASVQGIITLGYPDEKPVNRTQIDIHRVMFLEKYGGTKKSLSGFLYNWSGIREENTKAVMDGVEAVLSKEFKDYAKEIKAKWKEIQKKVEKNMKRKKRQYQ